MRIARNDNQNFWGRPPPRGLGTLCVRWNLKLKEDIRRKGDRQPVTKVETMASIFSGIGGIELGVGDVGVETIFQCEIWHPARNVLNSRFKSATVHEDVAKIESLPTVDMVSAGFPCQDLSQAGRGTGINGKNSSLVQHVFSLIERKKKRPKWILLENVPFMLQLDRGNAMETIVRRTEELGYCWAYRTVDLRSFGLPQRRRRVIFLASNCQDPRGALLADSVPPRPFEMPSGTAHGFYWTEGNSGLGWTIDGVPTLKGGSTIGIPSPPAIWFQKDRLIATPDIRDAERLQGFPPDWTKSASKDVRLALRWKLVGNAFPVPIGRWLGSRVNQIGTYDWSNDEPFTKGGSWPSAAWGKDGKAFSATVTEWPIRKKYLPLDAFLKFPVTPLSFRATAGFYRRASASSLRIDPEFLTCVRDHMLAMNVGRKIQ